MTTDLELFTLLVDYIEDNYYVTGICGRIGEMVSRDRITGREEKRMLDILYTYKGLADVNCYNYEGGYFFDCDDEGNIKRDKLLQTIINDLKKQP